ncbi:hypothetical protein AB0C27_43980 [Nonomuraea sp. NPDC048882]|uniref:hypothetical protein n=1 Tax=Nonomuraea sp. NPDC048882 TaxID=3154347 RepID=UPI0033DCD738
MKMSAALVRHRAALVQCGAVWRWVRRGVAQARRRRGAVWRRRGAGAGGGGRACGPSGPTAWSREGRSAL